MAPMSKSQVPITVAGLGGGWWSAGKDEAGGSVRLTSQHEPVIKLPRQTTYIAARALCFASGDSTPYGPSKQSALYDCLLCRRYTHPPGTAATLYHCHTHCLSIAAGAQLQMLSLALHVSIDHALYRMFQMDYRCNIAREL
jgi:hypothetical protein